MNDRFFHLRLQATYQGEENQVDDLNVEHWLDDAWQSLDLGLRTPGFLMYVAALFSCQHLYLRANCAERDLLLDSVAGELRLTTSEIWEIRDIEVSFRGRLKSGEMTDEAMGYITGRMHHCPVSTNLPDHVPMQVKVHLE